jgi:hypothetical protein
MHSLKLAEVVYVESANATSRPVTSCLLPSDCFEEPGCVSSCDLRGDFALLSLRSGLEQTVMLIKLSTAVCRTFQIWGVSFVRSLSYRSFMMVVLWLTG